MGIFSSQKICALLLQHLMSLNNHIFSLFQHYHSGCSCVNNLRAGTGFLTQNSKTLVSFPTKIFRQKAVSSCNICDWASIFNRPSCTLPRMVHMLRATSLFLWPVYWT